MHIKNLEELNALIDLVTPVVVARQRALVSDVTPQPRAVMNLEEVTEICRLVTTCNKIEAIKLVRNITNLGLKDAKDVVEGSYRPTQL